MPANNKLSWISDIKAIKGIGPKTAGVLKSRGINTIGDLLTYLPYRWENVSKTYSVAQALEKATLTAFQGKNAISDIVIVGCVENVQIIKTPRKRMSLVTASLYDCKSPDTKIKLVWFNQTYIKKLLKPNKKYILRGRLSIGPSLTFQNPKILRFLRHGVTPVYRKIKNLTSSKLHKLILEVIKKVKHPSEYIPFKFLNQLKMPALHDAFQRIHDPTQLQDIPGAILRLSIQELLEVLKYRSLATDSLLSSVISESFPSDEIFESIKQLASHLPFKLTQAQEQAINELQIALSQKGNHRILVHGDVGSGKTVLATLLAAAMLQQGYSTFFLAPTYLLAYQHYQNLQRLLPETIAKNIHFIHSSKQVKNKKPETGIFVGTHALLNIPKPSNLGLVVIDEEQKFGINQRFNNITPQPITLMLSATPIPRTLATAFMGVQSIISLKSSPFASEKTTKLVNFEKLDQVIDWLNDVVNPENKVIFVFPRVQDSEVPSIATFEEFINQKTSFETPALHGGLNKKQQKNIIDKFRDNRILGLLTTSIVEVGLDVKGANILVVFGPEYFGLSQLHQMRGRVGRTGDKSYAILLVKSNLPPKTLERLKYFAQTTDGLKLAMFDLKNRGPGGLFHGTKQTGFSGFKIADPTNLWLLKTALEIFTELERIGQVDAIPFLVRTDLL